MTGHTKEKKEISKCSEVSRRVLILDCEKGLYGYKEDNGGGIL